MSRYAMWAVAIVKWIAQFVVMLGITITAPVLVFFALPFARQDTKNIFPSWLQWLNTYDDTGCDQGDYEVQIENLLSFLTPIVGHTAAWYVKTWVWLGWRNAGYGLMWMLAPQIRFHGGAVIRNYARLIVVEQDGKLYFDVIFNGTWSNVKKWSFRLGWKLFAITQFFDPNNDLGRPALDRPCVDFSIRPYSSI